MFCLCLVLVILIAIPPCPLTRFMGHEQFRKEQGGSHEALPLTKLAKHTKIRRRTS